MFAKRMLEKLVKEVMMISARVENVAGVLQRITPNTFVVLVKCLPRVELTTVRTICPMEAYADGMRNVSPTIARAILSVAECVDHLDQMHIKISSCNIVT